VCWVRASACGLLALATLGALSVEADRPVASTAASSSSARVPGPALATGAGIVAARRYARRRHGTIAFAVLDGQGRLRGLRRTRRFASASLVKAMLMVAVLRRVGAGRLAGRDHDRLRRMITASSNGAARAIYRQVGGAGLRSVARAAGARRFRDVGYWSGAQVTAADQARLFLRIDRLVPPAHRRYARRLLSSIVGWQRWGIAPVARDRGIKIFFKGGWRRGIVHQVALLERGGRRIALAVLISGAPSMAYGVQTIGGIARRVLR
jgi:beta-lactamase family protein